MLIIHSSSPIDQSVPGMFPSQFAHLFPVTYIDSRHERVSAEVAYLTPQVLARPNLKVVTLARVTKIIFDSSSGTPRAVAVEFANEKQHTPRFRARALKEVIVWYVLCLFRHAFPQCSTAAEQCTRPRSSCSPASALHLSSTNTIYPSSLTLLV